MSTTESPPDPRRAAADVDDGAHEPGWVPTVAAAAAPVLVVFAAIVWAYWADLGWLWETWSSDPNYSHGFLVIPLAFLIFWRRPADETHRSHPWPWAWLLLVGLLALRAVLYQRGSRWAAAATLLPVVACLVLTRGGFRLLQRAWPAIAFLIFMIPLPPSINDAVAQPLQSLATDASVALLRLTGLWVISEGNVIYLGKVPLMVAEACNGLSMMMCLAATAVAAICLLPLSLWMRAVVLVSALPIALASNVLRIVATGWSIQILGPERGGTIAHDAAGWLMMPVALVLVALELGLLHWLFVEEETAMQPMLLGKPILGRPRAESDGAGPQAGLPSSGPRG